MFPSRRYATVPAAIALALLASCANQSPIQPPLEFERSAAADAAGLGQPGNDRAAGQRTSKTPALPAPAKTGNVRPAPPKPGLDAEVASISLNFDQLPLPTFIQTVYGSILKKNFSIDPVVAARQDLITFRSSQPQKPSQVEDATRMLLKSYGVAVIEAGGFLRLVPDNNLTAYAPEIRRGRAMPDVPLSLRPIFYLVELRNVTANNVATYLKQIYGTRLNVTEDPQRAAVLLSGQADDVSSAMEMVEIFDQPMMTGVRSVRYSPQFWNVDELAKKLGDVLTVEGYTVSSSVNAAVRMPMTILPIPAASAMILFSRDDVALNHALKWAEELDRPVPNARGSGFFTYQVRNGDADAIAKTLQQLLDGGGAANAAAKTSSKVIVNAATNSLIVQGQADQSQLINLLRELDKPVKSALVEVTVAEVSTNSTSALGVQWRLANSAVGANGALSTALGPLTVSTSANNGVVPTPGSTGNLLLSYLSGGQLRAVISAVAHDEKSKILSTPSLMVRSGEEASIQVGSDVPVVTGTLSNGNTGSATTTTVQYRNSGIVLNVKPVIYSSGRIDLNVVQEVSKPGEAGAAGSPKFDTRKISTKLSLRDGNSVMLAGLMRDDSGNSDDGIPLLKDIPVLGAAFKSQSKSSNKTELVVLITAYVINDDYEAEAVTNAFRKRMGPWAANPQPLQTRPALPVQPVATAEPAVTEQTSQQLVDPAQQTPNPADAAPVRPVTTEGGAAPNAAVSQPDASTGGIEFSKPQAAAAESGTPATPPPPIKAAPGSKLSPEELQKLDLLLQKHDPDAK